MKINNCSSDYDKIYYAVYKKYLFVGAMDKKKLLYK